jgi:hypothetical protein
VGWSAVHCVVFAVVNIFPHDLNPAGVTQSEALAANGSLQVGYGDSHAMLWSGTAASAIDLGSLLPFGWSSEATAIDASGNIFGFTQNPSNRNYYAIEWSPVGAPEPASLSVLALGSLALLRRRGSAIPKASQCERIGATRAGESFFDRFTNRPRDDFPSDDSDLRTGRIQIGQAMAASQCHRLDDCTRQCDHFATWTTEP